MKRMLPWRKRSPVRPAHMHTGTLGEQLAIRHLRRRGMTVLGRNVKLGRDEIDIVAFDPLDRVIAFVEVKTRTNKNDYRPELNMTSQKKARMLRAARKWVATHGYDGGYRLDAAYVCDGRVEYIIDLHARVSG